MKIALITANIGGIDDVLEIPEQTMTFDRIVYAEQNLPYPLPNFDNRTRARYFKMMPHRYLPGYDIYIWLDGRVQVTSNKFIEEFVRKLTGHDFVCTLHPSDRKHIYDELKFILHEMNKGNHYLISRYGHQYMRKELEFYYANNFSVDNNPLLSSGMFARLNSPDANACCAEWFMRSLEFTNFDQAMLSYVLDEFKMKVNHINYTNEIFTVLKHKPHDTY